MFKTKIGADGKVEDYKARFVDNGYRQLQGIDYEKLFSLITMLKSTRIVLAIATYNDDDVWKMDVNTALLYRNLEQ